MPSPARLPVADRLVWVEVLKAVALIWIWLNHLTERLFGYPYIANPSSVWPPFPERVAQLQPLHGHGWWDLPLNLLRYTGWAGDQGVQLFLILSGFGLTWGLLKRQGLTPLRVADFYRGRARRIYPAWWVVHLAVFAVFLALGKDTVLNGPEFFLSFVGIRATPPLLYYLVPAWWYVGVLIQLCLVYPLLWAALRRYGPLRLLLGVGGIALVVRGAGLMLLPAGIDAWARGAIFITRLPEFVCGISFAAWLFATPVRGDTRLRARSTLLLACVAYLLGTVLSLSLIGMTVAPVVLGVAAFVICYASLAHLRPGRVGPWVWIGRHSYALFLVHQPVISLLVPSDAGALSTALSIGAAIVLTVAGALLIERGADVVVGLGSGVGRRRVRRVVAGGVTVYALLFAADQAIRRLDPQEVFGWGERPSLEPDSVVGWRLKPARRTHLRWESYDYSVAANALGFPGPEYSSEKPAHTLRVLVTGDAFTSAEGVDTEQSWPRQLEYDLAQRVNPPARVEVLNFAITGYGPNQYAAVVEQFAPRYRPDLIVIGFFVNDFEDALMSTADFQSSIGFDRAPSDGWLSILTLAELRQWLKLHVGEDVYELLRRQPGPHGYFLGQFAALERDDPALSGAGRRRVAERLGEIARTARAIGARVLIAMIPAPVQVCRAQDLSYFPRFLDLQDTRRFDTDRPQRVVGEVAADLQLGFCDLRPALMTAPEGCPYRSHNLHWTVGGHRAVAEYLGQYLLGNGFIGTEARAQ